LGTYPSGCRIPSAVSLESAKLYLAGRIRTRAPLGAAEYLDFVKGRDGESWDKRCRLALECMRIYRALFPGEWANSTSPYLSTQREQELYRLVDEHLFPLRVSETIDVDEFIRNDAQFYTRFIPMRGLQSVMWVEGQFKFEEIPPAFRLTLAMSRQMLGPAFSWNAVCQHYGLENEPAPAPPLAAVGWSLFNYSCMVEPTPLRHFPLAFHFTTYQTGNAWLDIPQIGFFGFDWSLEKVLELTKDRVEAEDMSAAIVAVSNWFEEDPPARIAHAVELWNDAAEKERESGGEGLIHDERGEFYRREDWF